MATMFAVISAKQTWEERPQFDLSAVGARGLWWGKARRARVSSSLIGPWDNIIHSRQRPMPDYCDHPGEEEAYLGDNYISTIVENS